MTSRHSIISRAAFTLIALLAIFFNSTAGWRSESRPKLFGKRLQLKMLSPSRPEIQRKIVHYHNMFRSRVKPPARDMLAMTWHRDSAVAAQRWAEACQFLTHDNSTGRFVDAYGSCGQNIFISTHNVPWFFAIKMWNVEKNYFEYNSSQNNLTDVGHYTQLVWAKSHKVGCGLAKCESGSPDNRTYISFVCNYCPIGNDPVHLGRPYSAGPWCASCERNCISRKLCTNACPAADRWTNCGDLFRAWPHWLCKGRGAAGEKRRKNCQATCLCDSNSRQVKIKIVHK